MVLIRPAKERDDQEIAMLDGIIKAELQEIYQLITIEYNPEIDETDFYNRLVAIIDSRVVGTLIWYIDNPGFPR